MTAAPDLMTPGQRAALHVGPGQRLPHDPLAFVLYARCAAEAASGFEVGKLDDVEFDACGRALVLTPSPAAERLLTERSGSFGGLVAPTHVAVAPSGDVYLADRARGLIKYFDVCDCAFKPLPCFDQLRDPVGLAVHGTRLYVADRGRQSVVVLALAGGFPRQTLRLPASTGLRKSWTPFAVAVDSRGTVYVSDPDHLRVDVFDGEGRWRRAWTQLGPVTHLTVDRDDVLVFLGVDPQGESAAFEIVEDVARRLPSRAADLAKRFPCARLVVDRQGRMHLGSFCAGSPDAIFDSQGSPVQEKDRAAALLYSTAGTYLSAPLDSRKRGCVWHRVQFAGTLPARTAVEIQTTTSDVELSAGELADLEPHAWSEPVAVHSLRDGLADALVRSPPGRFLWLRLILTGDGHATPAITRIVVEFPRISLRRYLPAVFGMDPMGADFTDRFTAIFDTTMRSIESRIDTLHELFDPATAPAERPKARSHDGAPTTDFLSWLAGWIGVTLDRQWPEATRRALLKRMTCAFGLRGTRFGLWHLLVSFLGFDRLRCDTACAQDRCTPRALNCAPAPSPCAHVPPPLILEHFRLRRWLFVGAGKLGDDAMLWGRRIVNRSELGGNARVGPLDCPADRNPSTQLISTPDPLRDPFHVYAHRFSVFVPARVRRTDWQRRGLERLLAQEAPAHTQWQIEYVEPRFRIGVQATIGLDSVIARIPSGVRLNENALGRGTVLQPRPERAPAVGISARVGGNTRLN